MKYNSKGFTLLELIIVITILGIVASLVVVSVGKNIATDTEKVFVHNVTQNCIEARTQAIIKGDIQALFISSSERRCWITGKREKLKVPASMLIEGEDVGQPEDDRYAIYFYPDGSSSGGVLILSVPGRFIYRLEIDPLTGKIVLQRKDEESNRK